ncbi:MAG: 50S ribosomal protein L18 [Fidelibacterota bacterium]
MKEQQLKSIRRTRRRRRSKNLFANSNRPRLVVYRSLKHIYAQIIDDSKGDVLVSASTTEVSAKAILKNEKSKINQSSKIGLILAERAKKKKIKQVIFDRNGFLYHGRVKALADGAREGGLEF